MILLFAKYPQEGKVKTRLIPALGATRAMRLHRRMTEAALDTALASGLPVVVCATGAPLRHFRAWLGNGPAYIRQGDGDLGRRMERAFTRAFRQGTDKTLAIGADVPGLTPKLLLDAAAALNSADVVLGPAADGGYYLMGMRRLRRRGRVVTLPDSVTTSARQWRKYGVLRAWLMNRAMLLGYWLGRSDVRLSRFYRK